MRTLKKTLILLLSLLLSLSLVSCGNVRKVASTREEREVIMTLGEDEVAYELYRYVFLNQKRAVDNGDVAFWETADKQAYFELLDAAAKEEIYRIYALFSMCREYGVDPFDKTMDKAVQESLNSMVGDGGYYEDRKEYLADIRQNYMNDSVSRLYIRYELCLEELTNAMLAGGDLDVSEADAIDYLEGAGCAYVRWIYLPFSLMDSFLYAYNDDAALAESMMEEYLSAALQSATAADDEEFTSLTHQYLQDMYHDKELERGFFVGKYEYSDYYKELTEACFALSPGQTSGLVASGDGYYIIRAFEKPNYLDLDEDSLSDLVLSCRNDRMYQILAERESELAAAAELTDAYAAIAFDSVTAP